MFARFSRSWNLVKASAAVLMQDKELLLFPLISTGAMVIVFACFAVPRGSCTGLTPCQSRRRPVTVDIKRNYAPATDSVLRILTCR